MNRRGFLGAMLAAGAAPAIVKASSLMPIWTPKLWTPTEFGPMTATEVLATHQRMYNYWMASVTEMIALSPKQPWLS